MTDTLTLYHWTNVVAASGIRRAGAIKRSTVHEVQSSDSKVAVGVASLETWKTDAVEHLVASGVDIGPLCVHLVSDPRASAHPFAEFERRVRFTVRVPRQEAKRWLPWVKEKGMQDSRVFAWEREATKSWYVVERDIPESEWVAVDEMPPDMEPSAIDKGTAAHRRMLEVGEGGAEARRLLARLSVQPTTTLLPGLSIGGTATPAPAGGSAFSGRDRSHQADVIVDMAGYPGDLELRPGGALYMAYPMLDVPLIPNPTMIRSLAETLAGHVREGREVLIRCELGLNRSGLVAARALIALGYSPRDAVGLVRYRRDFMALFNSVFESWLLHEEELPSEDPCPLCRAERISLWLHEDDECWVALCLVCQEPMVVSLRHGLPDPKSEGRMLEVLAASAEAFYGKGLIRRYRIDQDRRSIPDHWHAHARSGRGRSF